MEIIRQSGKVRGREGEGKFSDCKMKRRNHGILFIYSLYNLMNSITISLLMFNCLIMILVVGLMLMMMIDGVRIADKRILEQSSCSVFGPYETLHIVGGWKRKCSLTLGVHDTGSGSG